jgi:hypothetical protein
MLGLLRVGRPGQDALAEVRVGLRPTRYNGMGRPVVPERPVVGFRRHDGLG